MDKRNLVFNHVLKKEDFDEMQTAAEKAVNGVGEAVGKGILTGLTVSGSVSALTVSPGVCFDGLGRRIVVPSSFEIRTDTISKPSVRTKGMWCAVCLRYKKKEEGTVLDGNNISWAERTVDSYEYILVYGTEYLHADKPEVFTYHDEFVIISYYWVTVDGNPATWERIDGVRLETLAEHERSNATLDQTVHGIRQGHGGGFDADRLDGHDGSYYRNASNLNTGTIPSSRLNASHIRDKLKTVDGVGSGIDADRLDGQHLSDILDAIYPVGYTYAQYPGGKTPAAMGWPGRWDSKFETEGVFFRTPGGKAYPFGAGVQEDAFQRFAIAAKSVYGNSAGSQRGWSAHGGTYTQNGTSHARLPGSNSSYFADYSSHYGMPRTSTETRPKNRTFRVWIRTE